MNTILESIGYKFCVQPKHEYGAILIEIHAYHCYQAAQSVEIHVARPTGQGDYCRSARQEKYCSSSCLHNNIVTSTKASHAGYSACVCP